jgi:predicted S18 family serine protease
VSFALAFALGNLGEGGNPALPDVVAMFVSLVSLMTELTIRSDTAMTGEISLRGLVLPVGGIKEKVVAAARAGLKRVMLPARNRRDFDDIPEEARNQLEFIWLERVEEAIAAALDPATHEAPLSPKADLPTSTDVPAWQMVALESSHAIHEQACQCGSLLLWGK